MSITIPSAQLDKTFGCFFLSVPITSILWGVGCLQLYQYYETYWRSDKQWLKAYILLPWIFDTAQQIIILEANYRIFVRGIGNPFALLRLPESTVHVSLLSGITGTLVQCFFVRRVWYLSNKNHIIMGFVCISLTPQFVANLVYYGSIYNFHQITDLSKVSRLGLVINCLLAFSDTVLSVTMVLLLLKARSGFKRTDSIIKRLLVYIIGSGLVTSFCAIAAVICAAVIPDSSAYLLADMTIPKLYLNCMLAVLNARSNLHTHINETEQTAGGIVHLHGLSSASASRPDTSATGLSKTPRAIECRVSIDIEMVPGDDQKQVCDQFSNTEVY